MQRKPRILAISGSLRTGSHNSALVRAAGALVPAGSDLEWDDSLGLLPMYNADLDTERPPRTVAGLRARFAAADGLLIATPEHNASIPAALKNLIDWASTTPLAELHGKPVAILGASPGALGTARAQLALRQILASLGAEVLTKPEITVFRAHERIAEDGTLTDEFTVRLLTELITALLARIRADRPAATLQRAQSA
ncbi:NADPH-dependent FMN reductase [Sciscionella marina]|uniref:NADPH-dependent FMN reductase n=1 Tax=Sciscionella marina TaxID=508770 RepID=UPI00037FCCFD|nr:NADPH-dependent FMN reductase [Sciscionella marina]